MCPLKSFRVIDVGCRYHCIVIFDGYIFVSHDLIPTHPSTPHYVDDYWSTIFDIYFLRILVIVTICVISLDMWLIVIRESVSPYCSWRKVWACMHPYLCEYRTFRDLCIFPSSPCLLRNYFVLWLQDNAVAFHVPCSITGISGRGRYGDIKIVGTGLYKMGCR